MSRVPWKSRFRDALNEASARDSQETALETAPHLSATAEVQLFHDGLHVQ